MHATYRLAVVSIAIGLGLAGPATGQIKSMRDLNPRMQPRMEIDAGRVQANGILKIQGKHLDLYTDVRDRSDVSELVEVFDLAIEQWCEYFDVNRRAVVDFRLSGFLIEDRNRFQQAGLMPADLPDFLAGYNRGHEFWVYLQPGTYYTRHLVLHEGTHAFMQWFLGDSGPHWYSEGMAEKLAIHDWSKGKLKLNFRVTDRGQAEYWGRPKIIREARSSGKLKSIDDVVMMPVTEYRQVDGYAWSWALCEFLSQHPVTRESFAQLSRKCADTSSKFSVEFLNELEPNRSVLDRDWLLYLNEHDYGIDTLRIVLSDAVQQPGGPDILVHADRGWQKTQIAVKQGDRLKIQATGRFQIAKRDQPWESEAGGITIDYYQARPLGMLLAGVVGEEGVGSLHTPVEIGRGTIVEIPLDGFLCFRINDSPARMDDNSGSLKIVVEKLD